MPEIQHDQLRLPVEISRVFEGTDATKLNELADFFGIEPEKLAIYSLAVLIELKAITESRNEECRIFIGNDLRDSTMIQLKTPQEAIDDGNLK
jgi:hypothetical protein